MIKSCKLCPRNCMADRENGAVGFCLCSDRVRIARAAPHFWEEPCISGRNGSGTVFFSGCNLGCVYCQNAPICKDNVGRDITVEQLGDVFISLQEKGVHNINLVTPTPWVEHIKKALEFSWEKGLWLPVVYNCGGYESLESVRGLSGYIRIYLPDFKYADRALGEKLSSVSDYPEAAKAAIDEMVSQCPEVIIDENGIMQRGVIVRHLVLPGQTENSVRVLEYLHKSYGDSIYISIMNQYTPMPNMKGELSRRVSKEEYESVLKFAEDIGITKAYIQEGTAASESFVPFWNLEGVP